MDVKVRKLMASLCLCLSLCPHSLLFFKRNVCVLQQDYGPTITLRPSFPPLSPVCPEGQYQPLLSDANECKPCPPQSSTRDEGTEVCPCDANFIRHPDRPDDRCIRKLYIHPAHIEIGKFLDIIVYFASQSVC